MSGFKPGDVCEIVFLFHPANQRFVGREVTVLEVGICGYRDQTGYREDRIRLDLQMAFDDTVVPECLRLKKPPAKNRRREDLTPVKWSDCVWRPSGVSA